MARWSESALWDARRQWHYLSTARTIGCLVGAGSSAHWGRSGRNRLSGLSCSSAKTSLRLCLSALSPKQIHLRRRGQVLELLAVLLPAGGLAHISLRG